MKLFLCVILCFSVSHGVLEMDWSPPSFKSHAESSEESSESSESNHVAGDLRSVCKFSCSKLVKTTLDQAKDTDACNLGCGSMKTTFDKSVLQYPQTKPANLLGAALDTCFTGCSEIEATFSSDCNLGCTLMRETLDDNLAHEAVGKKIPESKEKESFLFPISDEETNEVLETVEKDGHGSDSAAEVQEPERDGRISEFFGDDSGDNILDMTNINAAAPSAVEAAAPSAVDAAVPYYDEGSFIIMSPQEFLEQIMVLRYIQSIVDGNSGGWSDDRNQLDLPANQDSDSSTASALFQKASKSFSHAAARISGSLGAMDTRQFLLFIIVCVSGGLAVFSLINIIWGFFKDDTPRRIPYTDDYYTLEKYNPALSCPKYQLPTYEDCLVTDKSQLVANIHCPDEKLKMAKGIQEV